MRDEQAAKMVEGLAVKGGKKAAAEQIKALYRCFVESDCTMVEVRRAVSRHTFSSSFTVPMSHICPSLP